MPIVRRSWTAVWASTQRWSMSLDILDWPKQSRGHGTEQSQSLSWDSMLNYCQILAKQLSKTGSDNDWNYLKYWKIHNKIRVVSSWRNLGTRLFVSSLSSLGLIFFRNCREQVQYWHFFRTRVERAQAKSWWMRYKTCEPSDLFLLSLYFNIYDYYFSNFSN